MENAGERRETERGGVRETAQESKEKAQGARTRASGRTTQESRGTDGEWKSKQNGITTKRKTGRKRAEAVPDREAETGRDARKAAVKRKGKEANARRRTIGKNHGARDVQKRGGGGIKRRKQGAARGQNLRKGPADKTSREGEVKV